MLIKYFALLLNVPMNVLNNNINMNVSNDRFVAEKLKESRTYLDTMAVQ